MKWFKHEEYEALQAAAEAYRDVLDADQPTNRAAGMDPERDHVAAAAGEEFLDRVEKALRGTDWRRVGVA